MPFGEGAKKGLVAPEVTNNSAVGGAYVPMLTLGIPGDAVTAVIIGALFIHRLKPGPILLIDTPHLFWLIVGNLALTSHPWGTCGCRNIFSGIFVSHPISLVLTLAFIALLLSKTPEWRLWRSKKT